jgi:hypothetical protein
MKRHTDNFWGSLWGNLRGNLRGSLRANLQEILQETRLATPWGAPSDILWYSLRDSLAQPAQNFASKRPP